MSLSMQAGAQVDKQKTLAMECARNFRINEIDNFHTLFKPTGFRLDIIQWEDTYSPETQSVTIIRVRELNRFGEAYFKSYVCAWSYPEYRLLFSREKQ